MSARAGVVWAYLEVPIGLWRFVGSVFTRVSVHKEARVLAKAEFEVVHSHNMYICRACAETISVSDPARKVAIRALFDDFGPPKDT